MSMPMVMGPTPAIEAQHVCDQSVDAQVAELPPLWNSYKVLTSGHGCHCSSNFHCSCVINVAAHLASRLTLRRIFEIHPPGETTQQG